MLINYYSISLSLSYDLQKTYRSLEYSQQQKSYKKYIFQKQNFFWFFFPSYHRYFRVRIRSKSCIPSRRNPFLGLSKIVYVFSLLCTLIYSSKCSLVPIVVCPFYVFFKSFLYTLSKLSKSPFVFVRSLINFWRIFVYVF